MKSLRTYTLTISLLFYATSTIFAHNNDLRQQHILFKNHQNLLGDARFDARISDLLSRKVLQFAQDVGKVVLKDSNAKTEVFSPLSIFGAMTLLLLGASGRTHQELMQLMGFESDAYLNANPWKIHEEFGLLIDDVASAFGNPSHPRPRPNWQANHTNFGVNHGRGNNINQRISIANGVFTQEGFSIRPEYRDAVLNVYRSTIYSLDFLRNPGEAARFIDNWVNEKTLGKIKAIAPDNFNLNTRIVMASALYFNAEWEKTFIDGATGQRKFYPDGVDHPHIMVDMMAHGGLFPYYDAKEYDCRILAIPYKHNLTAMYIILPNNSNRNRLRELQATLTADKIEDMISKMEYKTTVLLFPKMHLTSEVNLKRVFRQMGFTMLFDIHRSDLSLIASGDESSERPAQSPFSRGHQGQTNSIHFPSSRTSTQPTPVALSQVQTAPNQLLASPYPGYEGSSEEATLIFSRVGESAEVLNATDTASGNAAATKTSSSGRRKRNTVTYKAHASFRQDDEPPRLKDYILNKRLSKSYPNKKYRLRTKRQSGLFDSSASLKSLDQLRNQAAIRGLSNPELFVDEVIHKVDLRINEKGTEGGAATVTYLSRTGTDVVFRVEAPFMFLIRHEDTKLPIFYGTVYEPTDF